MWNPFKKKSSEAEVIDMHPAEKEVIRRFADGNEAGRDAAITIHRKYIPSLGVHGRGSPEQNFMSEVDNPCPDWSLRAHYRKVLLDK